MVLNVGLFQLSFKLKESRRGKLFSIIWDTESAVYSSALNTWSAIIKLDNSQQISY